MGIEKAQGPNLLPAPQLEAFALPGLVERTTQRPRANMHYVPARYSRITAGTAIYISTKTSVAATFLTNPESCEVSNCQERALSTLLYVFATARSIPARELVRKRTHLTGVLCEAVCKRKDSTNFRYLAPIVRKT